MSSPLPEQVARGSVLEVFLAFLRLGCTSFGGPIAHLGYFREAFVVRRRWIDDAAYADLVALSQFMPGPASSQVGFALGVLRGNGLAGGLAAWTAFTLPSAILLFIFALTASMFDSPAATGLLHGLKLVAVAVVAQAVWGMAKTLTPDRSRATIALVTIAAVVFIGGAVGQLVAIAGGMLAGLLLCTEAPPAPQGALRFPVSATAGTVALMLFFLLLFGLPLAAWSTGSDALALFDAFYRAGALVFGGGHVALPLLEAGTVATGRIDADTFIAGYGATQAVPGPLFTFAAYLGALVQPGPSGAAGAAIALVAIFVPGLLLVYGMLPFWDALRTRQWAQSGLRGANAAVVGILGAALYDPIWTSAVLDPVDFLIALAGFIGLVAWKLSPGIVVIGLATAGVLKAVL